MDKKNRPEKQQAKAKTLRSLKDLKPDPNNLNRGTERGREALAEALRRYGIGRGVVVDRNGYIIAGNKTVEELRKTGAKMVVVRSRGEKLLAVVRRDLDLSRDVKARQLAVADNRVAELDLDWDLERVMNALNEGVEVKEFFFDDELEKMQARAQAGTPDPDDPTQGDVKVVQLFYSPEGFEEFQKTEQELAQRYGTERVPATVLRAMEEQAKARGL